MDINDVKDLIKQARRPEKTVALCLRGDLQAEWEELERALAKEVAGTQTLATNSPIAARIKELEEEMRQSTLVFRLRALPRQKWQDLVAEHRPREGNEADKLLRMNVESFIPELIAACLVEPELDRDDLEALFDALSDGQYDKLSNAAWELNRSDVNVPFSRAASLMTSNTEGTSRRPSDSASPTNGSAGGNRKKSSTTSTRKAG